MMSGASDWQQCEVDQQTVKMRRSKQLPNNLGFLCPESILLDHDRPLTCHSSSLTSPSRQTNESRQASAMPDRSTPCMASFGNACSIASSGFVVESHAGTRVVCPSSCKFRRWIGCQFAARPSDEPYYRLRAWQKDARRRRWRAVNESVQKRHQWICLFWTNPLAFPPPADTFV